MRLQSDWCDIRLVVEAAIACLPAATAASVELSCDAMPARCGPTMTASSRSS